MKKKFIELCFPQGSTENLLRKMKLLVAFFFAGLLAVSASTYSQQTKFSLKVEDITVKEVFMQIEENSEFVLFYNEDYVDVNRKVSINAKEKSVEYILNEVFNGTNNSYNIYDRQIVILLNEHAHLPEIERLKISQPEKEEKGTGSIRGNIIDDEGMPMVGATIIIDKTTTGTTTDANGNYQLLGVPVGKQKIRFSFIGYIEEVREVEIKKGGVVVLDIHMNEVAVEIQGVVAYGQARGQNAAINQQLNAKGISNIISAEKLQELPDVNVAEAIGRLPGLMVARDRGEGQKIIIRGLSPKYNTIAIGGNIAPSTSTDDRSTDLNMISPEILGGVEVQKANTADKDASGLGGTVNLTIREAPSGLKMTANLLPDTAGTQNR